MSEKGVTQPADVIVIGLGAMGGAAAADLAARGLRVSAFDRYSPPHSFGSSHGRSRILRQAYFEDSRYVHLLLRARDLWTDLERESGQELFHTTGLLMIAPRGGQLVRRSAESARQFNLPHEMLGAEQLEQLWPQFRPPAQAEAVLEHGAGYLLPEACIDVQLARASRNGADLHFGEPVVEWKAGSGGVVVRTPLGEYSAGHLVVAAGPWSPQTLAALGLPLRVTRQVIFWFQPQSPIDEFRAGKFPIYLIEPEDGGRFIYGFPLTGPEEEGLKVGLHGSSKVCTPETICREVRPEDEDSIRQALAKTLPALAGRVVRAETCLYTMTPDENFILGPHPEHPALTLAAGFSGHGFKFAPVVGEIVGDLVTRGSSRHDIEMFSPLRFANSPGQSQ